MNVYELSASIVLNTGDFEESLNRAGQQTSAFGDVLKANLVSEAVISGIKKIAGAVLDVGKASLAAYGDYEQLVGGAQLMFGDAYDYINERSKQAYKNVQMSQNDYLRQVNGFATGLKTSMRGNAKAAAELADKIVTAEADVVAATGNSQEAVQNAFNGIMRNNYTMLDNLQLGIVPTKEGFESLIAKVNEWNEQNGRMTDYTIDNLADCQQALVDYIEMQGLSGYAAMEASGTIQGSVASMKSAWEDLLAGLGNSDSDIDQLTENFVDSLQNVLDQSIPIVWGIAKGIVGAADSTIDHLRETNTLFNAIMTAVEGFAVVAAGFTLKKIVDAYTAAGGAAGLFAAAQTKLNAALNAAPYMVIAATILSLIKAIDAGKDFSNDRVAQLTQTDGTITGITRKIQELNAELEDLDEQDQQGTLDFDAARANAGLYADVLEAKTILQDQLETMVSAENAAKLASGEMSTQAIQNAETAYQAAVRFSDNVQQIMLDYWNTYNSIYTGLFNAANVFTQVTEATTFGDEEKNQTGAEELRGNLEANTRFYEQYASDLEYVQGAAADAGVDLSALMEILGSMSTEDAAGAIASIREELELAGNDEERAKFINNWDSLLQDYSTAVSGATQPLAEAATGVHDQLNALLEEYTKSVEGMDQSEEAVAAAKATLDGLIFGIDQNTSGVLSSLDVLTSEMQSKLQADFSDFVLTIQAVVGLSDTTDGSHRSGLDYVPFDGYMAQLHAGERVLTASEASAYRSGNRSGGSAVPIEITIPLTLDGEQIGRAAAQYAWSEDRRNGI